LGRSNLVLFDVEDGRAAEALVSQAAVVIQNAWLFEQVRASNERLQALARKLVEVQESERYHIARELHDEAGQALSSLKIGLRRLEQDPNCPAHIENRLRQLMLVADGVLDELHRLAMDLRPAALDHLGLVAALEQYTHNLDSEKFHIQYKAVGFDGERLHKDVAVPLYRIVQEALTNAVRHASASNIGILLERGSGKVKIFIEDDGVGIDLDQLENHHRMGLVGMRERAEMLGGSLTIESSIGEGTSIIVEVPDVNPHSYRR
jgi:signal transduction histidine kinase